jgi:ABC-2 type transport system ATP-binding protein
VRGAAIETEALTRHFEGRVAVDGLTLSVPRGTVLGFLGPNGAGKTTTVRMLSGLIAPTSGRARVAGYAVGEGSDRIRAKVGVLTEAPGLYDRLTARENLALYAELHGLRRPDALARAEQYLGRVDLLDRAREKVGGFSKGMRQRLAIARALLHEPEVVFLDEPTSGLDPEAARAIRLLVQELRARGVTIVLATHNLAEAEALSDQVVVFKTRLLAQGTPAELRARLAGRGTRVHVGPLSPEREASLRAALAAWAPAREVALEGGVLDVGLDSPEADNAALVALLVAHAVPVTWVEPRTVSLEAVYLRLVEAAR